MNKPRMSDESIANTTGKSWDYWIKLLDNAGGRDMSHAEIAKWLRDSGSLDMPWWGQAVTIGYEQAIGRRVVGQNCEGNLVAGVSKTVTADLDGTITRWLGIVQNQDDFNGCALVSEPRVTSSEKWRYWRANLDNETNVNVTIGIKDASKCTVGIEHLKLADMDAVAEWKQYWKTLLAGM